MSLPERPGFLHALPVCDLFLILWVLFLLGSALMRQTGVAVELPVSQFELERFENAKVISLSPGELEPRIYFGRDAVDMEQLKQRLEGLRDEGAHADTVILMRTDVAVPSGAQRRVQEIALALDFKVALIGSEEVDSGAIQDAPKKISPTAPGQAPSTPQPAAD